MMRGGGVFGVTFQIHKLRNSVLFGGHTIQCLGITPGGLGGVHAGCQGLNLVWTHIHSTCYTISLVPELESLGVASITCAFICSADNLAGTICEVFTLRKTGSFVQTWSNFKMVMIQYVKVNLFLNIDLPSPFSGGVIFVQPMDFYRFSQDIGLWGLQEILIYTEVRELLVSCIFRFLKLHPWSLTWSKGDSWYFCKLLWNDVYTLYQTLDWILPCIFIQVSWWPLMRGRFS